MQKNNKHILLFFCLFILCNSCFVFADDTEGVSEPVQNDNNTSAPIVVDITQLLNKDTNSDTASPDTVYILEPELVSAETKSQRITAANATGLKAVILSLIGDYETTITDYTYQSGSSGYYSHSINIERDWSWICSCGIFAIVLYCTFKAIGGFLWRV